jgi:hypothetical protein
MIETLSQLVRKPSKASDHDLELIGWKEKQARVLKHMQRDEKLIQLLEEFKAVNDRLKFFRSKNDVKVYFSTQEKGGEEYLYARCFFNIDGKPREFKKYLGIADQVNPDHLDMGELKEIFLRMLKNYLAY